ncbi:hypothetical protein COF09_31720 [Bacillus toyonensis]|uniref:RICIN domain-containing protein n=1 Tax=Bacillus toyonensis TaxID=155322 RepID=UPI000BFB2E78|nr:RICIN domain-containing protein [Bacillus toyonensis]PHC34707.1 hypothetical protein COF09_31720 [Bacillus toyonensis]
MGDARIVELIEERKNLKKEKQNLIVPGIAPNLGNTHRIQTLEKQIAGLNDLHLEEKRSLYHDLTVAEGSFEATSGQKIMYKKADDLNQIENGTYRIAFSDAQGKVVDANNTTSEELQLQNYTGSAHQQWEFKYDDTKHAYQIINKERPNQVLARNTSRDRTHNVLIKKNEHKTEHYWELKPTKDGYFKLINKVTGSGKLGLAVHAAETHDVAKIIASDYTGNNEQKFKLFKTN